MDKSDLLFEQLRKTDLSQLATPANRRYGEAIYNRHGVELIATDSKQVEAWIGGLDGTVTEGGSQRRRTFLTATPERLAWHCTGNPKSHDIFCKHCVALALYLLEQAA